MPESGLAHLRLLQLVSPNLPTGAFTYSQGLEWAVECGWLKNKLNTGDWLKSILGDSLQYLELPLLARLYHATQNSQAAIFLQWSQQLFASRETFELRNEETQRARALFRLLKKLPQSETWPELETHKQALLASQIAGYALAASHWNIPLKELLQGYTWSWLENAVVVAIKLVPLGQSEGQQLLYELSDNINLAVDQALKISDDEIGASTPAMAIASSLHETQYTRLFRS
jgi:urease accessory protein